MNFYEIVGNLHMHTPYSDGEAYHAAIAEAAARAGLDFVVVTDHNVLVRGVEGYYAWTPDKARTDDARTRYVLLLTGEEIHDQARLPQVNHCLVYAAQDEMAQCARDPQMLIDAVNGAGGMAFLAHPADHPIEWVHESAIPWVDWPLQRYAGIEVWNYMSHFKDQLRSPLSAIRNAMLPRSAVRGPNADSVALWDTLLIDAARRGERVIGIGNSDAHGTRYGVGPLRKTVYPYEFLFTCVNTHLLLTQPLSGDLEADRARIWAALREGRCYIGYGVPGDPRGFRFSAHGRAGAAPMGGRLRLAPGDNATLQAILPDRGRVRLIHHGRVIHEVADADGFTFTAQDRGAYRVEVWRRYRGRERCWILSNPVYLY